MYFVVQHVCNMDASKNPQNINLVYRIVTKKIHSLKMSLPDWLAKLLDRKVINSPFLAVYHILLSHRSNVWILTMTMISTMFAFFVPSVFAGLRYFRQLRAGPRNRLSSSFTYNYSVYTACLWHDQNTIEAWIRSHLRVVSSKWNMPSRLSRWHHTWIDALKFACSCLNLARHNGYWYPNLSRCYSRRRKAGIFAPAWSQLNRENYGGRQSLSSRPEWHGCWRPNACWLWPCSRTGRW